MKQPYRSREVMGERGLWRGKVDGKPAWSNGFIMEIGTDTPFTRLKSVEWDKKDKSDVFQAVMDAAKSRAHTLATPTFNDYCYVRLDSEGVKVGIDPKYYHYFVHNYPGAQFMIASWADTVLVLDGGGILVGLIAPCHIV